MKNAIIACTVCLLTLVLGSCKKDTSAGSETCRVTSQNQYSGTTPNYTLYSYDDQGRIIATIGNQIYSQLTYTGDSVWYVEYRSDGSLNNSYWLVTGSGGRFIKRNTSLYQYDADGHLIQETNNLATNDYTWQDGDLVKMETRFSGVLKFVTTYSYHNDLNKANWDYNHSGLSCFFGQASKHLIKQSRTQNIDAGTTSETEWTYELNSKGLPEKMTILFVNLGSFSTYYYSYECE